MTVFYHECSRYTWRVLSAVGIACLISGCGGGGGGAGGGGSVSAGYGQGASSKDATVIDPTVQPSSNRSVHLNNFNDWWFTGGSSDAAQRLDMVAKRDNICYTEAATWTGITPQSIKAINPSAKVYQVYNLCVKPPQDDTLHPMLPVTQAEIDAKDWGLRDGNGNPVKSGSVSLFLDVGKSGFKEEYLKNLLDRLKGKGFDGVVFDYWWPYLTHYVLADGLPRPAAYPTDDDWFNNAWKPFIGYVMDGLHAAGYRVVGNCAGEYNWGDSRRVWQRTKVDATIYEQWAVDFDGSWLDGPTIERKIGSFSADPIEAWTADYGLHKTDPLYDQKQTIALAMYYVAIPMSQAKRSYHHLGDGGVFWEPIWDLNIGVPSEMAARRDGKYFWSRKYTDGIVLLNYEASASAQYTLDKTYHTLSGAVKSGTITVAPHTGVILAAGGS